MYTQTEKVNIEPKSYLPVYRVSQNDVGRTLKAHLISDEGTITIPVSATVTMAGIKPSGLGYTVTGTIDGSDVTFETDATMTDEAGQIESEIRIVDGETLIGTTNVVLNVEPNPHPNDVTDGQREPLVNEITALLNQITAQADRTEEYSAKVLNMTVSAHESEEPTVTKTEGEVVNLDFGLPRGAKGEQGERGERGEAGKDGKDGLDGKDGKDGINGVTPDFSIGTVTTLEPTESASVTLTGTEEAPVLNFGIPRGAKGEQGDVSLSDLEKVMVTDTASGAIASFPDGSDLLPIKSLTATIVPQQSGSGTPSPENIRPISGWESVETVNDPVHGGYIWWNQYAGNTFRPAQTKNNVAYTPNNDGTFTLNGTADSDDYWFCSPYNETGRIVAGHKYIFWDANKNGSATTFGLSMGVTTIQAYGDTKAIVIASSSSTTLAYAYKSGTVINNATLKPVFIDLTLLFGEGNEPSVDEFEALFPNNYYAYNTGEKTNASAVNGTPYYTHTTSLGRTVYGGTVDVVSGTLTVTHAIGNLEELDWSGSTASRYISNGINDMKPVTDGDVLPSLYAEKYRTIRWNDGLSTNHDGIAVANSSYAYFYLYRDENTLTPSGKFCYELATPTTYTLTPSTINTLLGSNNVWVESGDCSIEYYADTKLYIDKKLGGN